MKRFKISIATFISCSILSYAYNPDKVIADIVNANPGLETMKAQANAKAESAKASNLLSGPEAEFEHLWGRGGETKWSVGVTQSFDWPGLYKARKNAAYQELYSSMMAYNARKMDIMVQARENLVRLDYCYQRLEIIDGMIADTETLHTHLGEALDHGLITILDYKKSGLELTGLRIERGKIVDEQNKIIAALSELAGKPLSEEMSDRSREPITFIGSLNSLSQYLSDSEEKDPEINMAKSDLLVAGLNVKTTGRSLAPGFSVGYRHAKEDGIHYNGIAVGVTLPTWGLSRTISVAKSNEVVARNAYDEKLLTVKARIESEYRSAESLREQIKALRADGLDGSYLALLKEAYRGGEISVLDYLREQAYYRSSRLAILDLEEQYALLLTSLNRYALIP